MPADYFASLFGSLQDKAKEQQDKVDKAKQAEIDMYTQVALNPNTDPVQRKKASDTVDKLRGLKGKDAIYGPMAEHLNQLQQHLNQGNPQQQSDNSQQRPDGLASSNPNNNAVKLPTLTPTGGGDQDSLIPQPKELPNNPGVQAANPVKQAFAQKAVQKLSKGLSTAAATAHSFLTPQSATAGLPPLDPSVFPTTGQIAGNKAQAQLDAYDKAVQANHSPQEAAQAAGWKAAPGAGTIRLGQKIKASQAPAGSVGPDGQPVDVEGDGDIYPVIHGDGSTVWYPADAIMFRTTGNRTGVFDLLNGAFLGTSGPQVKLPTTTERAVPAVVNGEQTVNTLPTVSTPGTMPSQPVGGSTPAPANPVLRDRATGQPHGDSVPHPAVAEKSQGLPPVGSGDIHIGGATIRGLQSGQYNQQMTMARAIREGATQVFGDPKNPNFRGLSSYQALADNPQSRQRMGAAMNYLNNELDAEMEKSGGLWSAIQASGGVTQLLANANAEVNQKMRTEGWSKEEREAFASEMAAREAIIGLRSATKASAAQFSVKALQALVPMIGVNANSQDDFKKYLGILGTQITNATIGVSNGVMPKSEKDYYEKKTREATSPGDAPTKTLPKVGGAAPKTAAEYLQSVTQ